MDSEASLTYAELVRAQEPIRIVLRHRGYKVDLWSGFDAGRMLPISAECKERLRSALSWTANSAESDAVPNLLAGLATERALDDSRECFFVPHFAHMQPADEEEAGAASAVGGREPKGKQQLFDLAEAAVAPNSAACSTPLVSIFTVGPHASEDSMLLAFAELELSLYVYSGYRGCRGKSFWDRVGLCGVALHPCYLASAAELVGSFPFVRRMSIENKLALVPAGVFEPERGVTYFDGRRWLVAGAPRHELSVVDDDVFTAEREWCESNDGDDDDG
jgi:hypothetical protein